MNLSQENTLPPIDQGAIDLDPEAKTDAPFPVVGIAASAGGLEAFIQLLKQLTRRYRHGICADPALSARSPKLAERDSQQKHGNARA
jgi:chemotaxis response regulator CheB